MLVYTSPAKGREDEYNQWYDDVHLGEFSALPGVISGRRFKVEGRQARRLRRDLRAQQPAGSGDGGDERRRSRTAPCI